MAWAAGRPGGAGALWSLVCVSGGSEAAGGFPRSGHDAP